jgi:hypothetical protein
VVAKEARERIERIEKLSGGKLKRQERNAIICDVKVDLCKKAFVRSSLILALYNSKDNLLVVNTTNKNISSLVGSLLIKVVGLLKPRLYISTTLKMASPRDCKITLMEAMMLLMGLPLVTTSSFHAWLNIKKCFVSQPSTHPSPMSLRKVLRAGLLSIRWN